MLSAALGFPGDMGHCSVLVLEDQVFPKDCCHHDLKRFCEITYKSVLLNVMENRSKI